MFAIVAISVEFPVVEGAQYVLAFFGFVGLIMVIKWGIGIIF